MRVPMYGTGAVGNERRILSIALGLSMVCHVVLFAVLVYVPGQSRYRSFAPSVINVSIVALPSPKSLPSKESVEVGDKRATISRSKSVSKQNRVASKAVSAAPSKYKRKTSLKKKTFKSSTVVKHAISKIEKQVEQSRAEPVTKAIDDLRKTVRDTEKNRVDESGQTASVRSDASGMQGQRALELMDIYKAEIPYHIQNNWVFSEQLAGGHTDLIAWLVIEIRPDGSLRDLWFEKRSGNRYFDEQAYKAVKKSDPLPPLPKGYPRPYFNVGLRFTPSGLR